MIPKQYFEDEVSLGVATGTLEHLKNSRFCLVNLDVGFGKTIMSVLTSLKIREWTNKEVQVAIFSTKAKRLDKSFEDLVDAVSEHYGITIRKIFINGQAVATFTGFSRVMKKPNELETLVEEFSKKPTLIILDETHMSLRDATSQTNKNFKKFFKQIEQKNDFIKVAGFTATPIDNPLDIIGYLVFNGDYSSRTDFFNKEIIGYRIGRKRGLTHRDMEMMLLNEDKTINKAFFVDYERVMDKFKKIIYYPDAPRTFHIPKNIIKKISYSLSEEGQLKMQHFRKMEEQKAFSSQVNKSNKLIEIVSTDKNAIKKIIEICQDSNTKSPLIFYQFNHQREILRSTFEEEGVKFYEINAEKQTFFEKGKEENVPTIIQYKSGAVAFESKESNTSIYLGLPDSSIIYKQSLGRNTRRDQEEEYINNYILFPKTEQEGYISEYEQEYLELQNKMISNENFLAEFKSEWGDYREKEITS